MSSTQTASPDQIDARTARFETTRPEASTAVVVAHGELDAANVDEFIDYALRRRADTDRLIIDLSGLAFFATAGFTALHTLNVQCVSAQIRWALVPSPAVHRLLRICDPDAVLPTCADVDEALAAVQTDQPRLLQLVPEPS
ncbi:STAS domain-containing protein [Mycolicibacterium hippocampi]|uniref:Anti-sigma B factor antagonist RsbV n=1 Tax=Mycolicibacterium hippocampi TaxID=659824 RepID=A0A850PQB2_9MYCO|nr:STAS domain-containing protein [Mycolicibacterium hippocampi]NVN52818.1 Anti-sigma B factor antagonist RsbV [Mycolicibacterium hippocampi]